MEQSIGQAYYLAREADILALFDDHARAWSPLLADRYGKGLADSVLQEARRRHEALIPEIPYIGGDENPMTRHIVRSTTSMAFYLAMNAHGKPAAAAGQILYAAVEARVGSLPLDAPMGKGELAQKRKQALESRWRRYPGDWVWDFVEGDGVTFEYGYDFFECGTQKMYHAFGADAFLPFYCYLDFITYRTRGWSFERTMTLAEGHALCDFRFRKVGVTRRGWPPPFLGA